MPGRVDETRLKRKVSTMLATIIIISILEPWRYKNSEVSDRTDYEVQILADILRGDTRTIAKIGYNHPFFQFQ